MPRIKDIKKVLVIGSGPIIIGQAAEFDYAGTQACRSLKEEGLEVVLLNSNPATIMTDKDIADRVYIEPLTVEVVEQLILKEKPDSVLPTLGGQAALNLAMELDENGFLERNNVRLIGTTSETISGLRFLSTSPVPLSFPVPRHLTHLHNNRQSMCWMPLLRIHTCNSKNLRSSSSRLPCNHFR